MDEQLPISVVIITKNEERNIADCIQSVSFSTDIIIVDSGSTDNTRSIAAELGGKVIKHEWQGYGAQKNIGLAQAKNDWVLFLDADERVSPELAQTLPGIVESAEYNVYWVTIVDIFLGRKLQHLIGHNPRLIKKGSAEWGDHHVHERIMYAKTNTPASYKDGMSGEIQQPIIHESHTSIGSYLKKMHRYTFLDAQEMKRAGKHRSGRPVKKSWILPYRLAARQCIKLLFYRGGVLDGWQGVVWCALSAYYEFEMADIYNKL